MNKSSNYSMLSIVLTGKTQTVAHYTLAHARGREFSWSASLGVDRMTLQKMEVGKHYMVRVSSDHYGVQHWIDATEVKGSKKSMVDNEITRFAAKKKAEPKINPDFLVW